MTRSLETPAAVEGALLQGRYRLELLLGEGGMASVFSGHDTALNRGIAVKILRRQYATDPDFVARFQQEARLAAGVSGHPNIVSVYDVGRDGDVHYIVMELVAGRTVKQVIHEDGAAGWLETIEVVRQVCGALAYAHERGVVHRDVKPQNILLDERGTAKIADFGIAMAMASSRLTQPGMVVGSVDYMSPEQALGHPPTPSSDVYSLGLVLFEMLTGRLPFEGEDAFSLRERHARGVVPSPRDINPSVPVEVAEVVLCALRKNPSARYPSAEAFGQALEQLQRQTTRQMVAAVPRREPATVAAARTRRGLVRPALAAGVLVAAGIAYLGARAGEMVSHIGVAAGAAAGSTPGSATHSSVRGSMTRAPVHPAIRAPVSRPASVAPALVVNADGGAGSAALTVAGGHFHPGESVMLRLSWHSTSTDPGNGYRWYRAFQAVRAGADGSLQSSFSLPVSVRAFATSTVTVTASDAGTGVYLARKMASIHMTLPPAAIPAAPQSPQSGQGQDTGNSRGDGNGNGNGD